MHSLDKNIVHDGNLLTRRSPHSTKNRSLIEGNVTSSPLLPEKMDQSTTFITGREVRLTENGYKLPFDHSIIQGSHPGTSVDLKAILSKELSLKHDDSYRFSREMSLQFQHCPHCSGKDIVFYGKSPVGTQRYKCKQCRRQFVCQMDSVYPKLTRRDTFYREYDQEKHGYWKPALTEVLAYIESHRGKLLIHKALKYYFDGKIKTQNEYDILTFYIVHEVYNIIMAR